MNFFLRYFGFARAVALIAGLAGVAPGAGAAVWPELLTNGVPAEVAKFYTDLLGWQSEVRGAGATAAVELKRGGRGVAAVVYEAAAEARSATASRWVGFFPMENLVCSVAKVEAAGGRVLNAKHAGARAGGAQVLALDPDGAVFGMTDGAVVEDGGARGGVWPVLLARQPVEEAVFYAGLCGWRKESEGRTPLFAGDFLLMDGERARAAVGLQTRAAAGRSGWLLMFGVADLDDVVRRAGKAGGRVVRAPSVDLIGGRVAVLADVAGGVFGLYELVPLPAAAGRGGFEVEGISP